LDAERQLLQRLAAGPVSGDELAREAGLTRAAVWKRIESLRRAGIEVTATRGRGYTLAQPLDLLQRQAILDAMPAQARKGVHSLEVLWSVDSTNSELLRRSTSVVGASVLLAERQTGGRGRRGRQWASPLAANLYLSVARSFSGGLARLGGLGLVAGVAAGEALHQAGFGQVQLKWPNDLVVAERKLGGLLVEGSGENAGPARAVLGLGLNVRMPASAAAAIDQPWTELAALPASTPSRNALAAVLLAHLLPALERFDVDGLAPFLPRYARLDALRGRLVDVSTHTGPMAGTCTGIAEDGALCLDTVDGPRRFHAGETSVRAA